jgi:hypothetical protein
MAKQFHFVVMATEDGKLSVDYDTALAVMPDGAVWDEITQEWESEFDHSTVYEELSEKLHKLLNKEAN